jgi:hypothetical protein
MSFHHRCCVAFGLARGCSDTKRDLSLLKNACAFRYKFDCLSHTLHSRG